MTEHDRVCAWKPSINDYLTPEADTLFWLQRTAATVMLREFIDAMDALIFRSPKHSGNFGIHYWIDGGHGCRRKNSKRCSPSSRA